MVVPRTSSSCPVPLLAQTPAHLTSRDTLVLAAFSVLYTINIAVSNLSLQLVTVPVSAAHIPACTSVWP